MSNNNPKNRGANGRFINVYNDGLSYKERRLIRKYGITFNDYQKKLTEQLSGCSICNKTIEANGRLLSVDHNHETGKVRELLCYNCNVALGFFNDNPSLLLKAFAYLIKHKQL